VGKEGLSRRVPICIGNGYLLVGQYPVSQHNAKDNENICVLIQEMREPGIDVDFSAQKVPLV
jgi:hypothetical protein